MPLQMIALFGGPDRLMELKTFFGILFCNVMCLDSTAGTEIYELARIPRGYSCGAADLAKRGVMTVILSFGNADHIYVSLSKNA